MSKARLALPPGRAMLPACCCAVADATPVVGVLISSLAAMPE